MKLIETIDIRARVESCIESFKNSAEELREAAEDTENEQARNTFQQSAEKVEGCIQQVQIALNQLK